MAFMDDESLQNALYQITGRLIDTVSIVPDSITMQLIVRRGKEAEVFRLSKMPSLTLGKQLKEQPDDFIPFKSPLHLAAKREGATRKGSRYAALRDRNLCYWTSFGVNLVLLNPSDTELNLFSATTVSDVVSNIDTLLNERNALLPAILQMTAENIDEMILSAPAELRERYALISELFSALGNVLFEKSPSPDHMYETLKSLGVDAVSFCQTWDPISGNANFSALVPHSQTFITLFNPATVMAVTGTTLAHIQAYTDVLSGLGRRMTRLKYTKTFINISAVSTRRSSIPEKLPIFMPIPLKSIPLQLFAPCKLIESVKLDQKPDIERLFAPCKDLSLKRVIKRLPAPPCEDLSLTRVIKRLPAPLNSKQSNPMLGEVPEEE